MFGETVTFTGELAIPRHEAAQMAAAAGADIATSVTRKTTILVVGMQDTSRLNGYDKSTKHRKAENLIREGAGRSAISNHARMDRASPLGPGVGAQEAAEDPLQAQHQGVLPVAARGEMHRVRDAHRLRGDETSDR